MSSARLNFTHYVHAHISLELVSGNAEGPCYQQLCSLLIVRGRSITDLVKFLFCTKKTHRQA